MTSISNSNPNPALNQYLNADENWIEAHAPSNIALIKYMGKVDSGVNKPANSSLSWTLENLKTFVRIRLNEDLKDDVWNVYSPTLARPDLRPLELSESGQKKFLQFFKILKTEFKLQGFFQVESANNFPSDCGLASSASSFAALTKCAHEFFIHQSQKTTSKYLPKELARLSQKGSGSSCRSFFSPWSLWHAMGAEEISLPIKNLKHLVVLCDESKKQVSSSQAHQLVLTSDLFPGRPERANSRLQSFIQLSRDWGSQPSNAASIWKSLFELCWNEFWDMHVLFHTSKPPFMYMNAESFWVLNQILGLWSQKQDGPLVTLDAGSNIHLLFRQDQSELVEFYKNIFNHNFNLWTDEGYLKKYE